MDIELDDFLYPPFDESYPCDTKNSHYYYGMFGDRLLRYETCKALSKAIREKAPTYRKERREWFELWIKAGLLLVAIIGTATGFVSAIKH